MLLLIVQKIVIRFDVIIFFPRGRIKHCLDFNIL